MGSRVSRSTSLTSRSVISAKVKLADRCRSMLSEYTSVLSARRGSPEKKSVSARCGSQYGRWDGESDAVQLTFSRKPSRSATASPGYGQYMRDDDLLRGLPTFAVGQHGVVDAVSRPSSAATAQPFTNAHGSGSLGRWALEAPSQCRSQGAGSCTCGRCVRSQV